MSTRASSSSLTTPKWARALDDVLGDTFLELELTPNRGDCLSILGVAREIGAITRQQVHVPEISYSESATPVSELAKVSIADPDLCLRYTASVITGITIGPSPHGCRTVSPGPACAPSTTW